MLLRQAPSALDKAAVLFSEVAELCEQAVDEAKRDAAGEGATAGAYGVHGETWQSVFGQLQTYVTDELRAADARNVSQGASLEEQIKARLALEETVKAIEEKLGQQADAAAAGRAADGAVAGAAAGALPAPRWATVMGDAVATGIALPGGYVHPAATADLDATVQTSAPAAVGDAAAGGGLYAAAQSQQAANPEPNADSAAAAAAVGTAALQQTQAPGVATSEPLVAGGVHAGLPDVCAGKRCPDRYHMINRGDRCTCRPAVVDAS